MRDALAEAGADPALLNPTLPVDVSVDHSLAVEVHARPDAARVNIGHEIRRNGERYRFLRWAAGAARRAHPSARHRHHAYVKPGTTGRAGARAGPGRRTLGRARHDDRHRQPHAHDQRHRRAGLGRGRTGSADGHVRHAHHAAHSRRDRGGTDRRPASRRTGHRPGADGHAAAAPDRRVRRVRGILRPRRRHAVRRQPGRGRQHGAGIRRHHRLLPARRAHAGLSAPDRQKRGRTGPGARLPAAQRPLVRPPGPPALHAHHHHRAGRHRQPRGRPAPAARPAAAGGRAGRAGRERPARARRTACRPIPWPSPRSPAAPTPRTRRC